MCCNEKQQGGQKPENLTGTPGDCWPKQIRQCHGDVPEHRCMHE
jgi:hypothetical protein